MLATLCGILVTILTFLVTAVAVVFGYLVILIPQVWNLGVQIFNVIKNLFC